MLEFLKHLFGFCGESHWSVLQIFMAIPAIGYLTYLLKEKYIKLKQKLSTVIVNQGTVDKEELF